MKTFYSRVPVSVSVIFINISKPRGGFRFSNIVLQPYYIQSRNAREHFDILIVGGVVVAVTTYRGV